MNQELTYYMALAHAERLLTRRKNEIVVACYKTGQPLSAFFLADPDTWAADYGIDAEEKPYLLQAREQLPNYSFQLEDLLEQGYLIIPITSEQYPASLKQNLKYNAPVVLYAKGNASLLGRKCVAVVGSRGAQPVSLMFTQNVARKAVSEGSAVVSGGAKGVDSEALRAALDAGGESIIVLPQGITTFASGLRTFHKPLASGRLLVVSAFHPAAPWAVGLAMARNPIVYAFADDIFVAESDQKGGTFQGVVDGLRKQRTIYVRQKEADEKCANDLLIDMGATPVDMEGREISVGPKTDYEALLRKAITDHPLSARDIALRLYESDDRTHQARAKRLIASLADVETVKGKPLRFVIHSQKQATLFDPPHKTL